MRYDGEFYDCIGDYGKGLAGIFVALIIIAICVWIMQKIFNR